MTVAAPAFPSARLSDFLALTKPRIVLLVMLTAAVGFYLGASAAVGPVLLLHTLIGTALVAGGTGALNQVAESAVDRHMRRTAARPIPAGRMDPRVATTFALGLGAAGTIYLWRFVNAPTAGLAALTFVWYILLYTPLKRHTSLNTLVGAVPGALPILGGWTASGAALGAGAWSLFWIMFLWQLPHFLALAWLYRDDYGRAGLRMLSVDDPDGRATFGQALLYATALVPTSLMPSMLGLAGRWYFFAALALGLWFAGTSGVAFHRRTPRAARRLFLVSITYLAALLAVLAWDKTL